MAWPTAARVPGSGGSGGLRQHPRQDRRRIAIRDCAHAWEPLELAEGFTQEERGRPEWMITVAERGLVPFLEKALPHISRVAPGHFAVDTAQARELIQTTVIEEHFVGISADGNRVYARLLEAGAQPWAFVRDGTHQGWWMFRRTR